MNIYEINFFYTEEENYLLKAVVIAESIPKAIDWFSELLDIWKVDSILPIGTAYATEQKPRIVLLESL